MGAPGADLRIELFDQAVARGYAVNEAEPEPLVAAGIEIVECHTLLFHPGVVTEIEDALAIEVGKLEHVIVDDAFQMAAEDLAGVHFIEPIWIAARQEVLPLTGIELGAVSGDRHDHVVFAVVEVLGELDGGDDIRQSGNADILESAHHGGIDLASPDQITAPGIAAEQQVERIARQVGDTHNNVGVHHIMDEWNMLVADTLDVVLAVAVAQ